MTKALTKKVMFLEAELDRVWNHVVGMAESQKSLATELHGLKSEVAKVVSIIRAGLILLGATLLQLSGDPAAKELASLLKQVLGLLLR
jgi:hypothetical protein